MASFRRAWLLAIAMPLLAACSGIYGANVPGGLDARRVDVTQPVVHEQVLAHQVNYQAAEAIPSPAEQARLADFLFARNVTPGSFVAISVAPAATPALTAGREQGLRSLLQRWGYQAGIAIGQVRAGNGQSAVLIIQQLVLLPPPGCAGDSAAAVIAKPNEAAISRMGCVTAHNLGVMVADKSDLLTGGPTVGATDGERAAQLFEYYRTRPHALERGEEADPGDFAPSGGS